VDSNVRAGSSPALSTKKTSIGYAGWSFLIYDVLGPKSGSGAKVGYYAKRLDNLNKKKSIFLTPLN
jgi:hypothetical protein